jgi:hypothetical protein
MVHRALRVTPEPLVPLVLPVPRVILVRKVLQDPLEQPDRKDLKEIRAIPVRRAYKVCKVCKEIKAIKV